MLLRANMLLSMASLVIFMQLRVLYEQLCGRLRRHGNYKRLLKLVELVCTRVVLDLKYLKLHFVCLVHGFNHLVIYSVMIVLSLGNTPFRTRIRMGG